MKKISSLLSSKTYFSLVTAKEESFSLDCPKQVALRKAKLEDYSSKWLTSSSIAIRTK